MNIVRRLVILSLLAAVIVGLVPSTTAQGGDPDPLSCQDYPLYCVPLVGGAPGDFEPNESAGVRTLDAASSGAFGVVRGFQREVIDANRTVYMPFIGDPDALIHFTLITGLWCPQCWTYHAADFRSFIQDKVLNGQASVRIAFLNGGDASGETATEAVLCAGEQGAFWEMNEQLFWMGEQMGTEALSPRHILQAVDSLGLDSAVFTACMASGRYVSMLDDFEAFAAAHGITGVPTVSANYGEPGVWENVERSYNNLVALTEAANTPGEYAPGTPRGFTEDGTPYLGDPNAPVHFLVFQNFTCGHCSNYHRDDLARFIPDYVQTGQAALYVRLMAFGSQPYSDYAALATLCAGEQGAYWEMQNAVFASKEGKTASEAYSLERLYVTAGRIGLDADALIECVQSERYAPRLEQFDRAALELGVTGTPMALVRFGPDDDWEIIGRGYDNLQKLTLEGQAGVGN